MNPSTTTLPRTGRTGAPQPIRIVPVHPLSRDAFAPFGDVIDVDASASARVRAINQGSAARIDDLTALDLTEAGGKPALALFRTTSMPLPIRLRLFERHRHGSQTFVPLAEGRCLAVVALGADQPDLSTVRAFITRPGQGFTIRRNIWHHPLITPAPASVLVLDRQGQSEDNDERPVLEELRIVGF